MVSSELTVSGVVDVTPLGLDPDCVMSVTGDLEVTGAWFVGADMMFLDNTVTTGAETLALSAECRRVESTPTTCQRISVPIRGFIGYGELTCIDNTVTDGCICEAVVDQTGGIGLAPTSLSTAGNYTAADGTLTVSEGEQEYTYCVTGTTLTLTPVSTGPSGTITGTVVHQKQ